MSVCLDCLVSLYKREHACTAVHVGCTHANIGSCHLRHPSMHVSGFLLFRIVLTLTHLCMWVSVHVCGNKGDDVLCAAPSCLPSPTVKVISLFSPLPAAATRDRLTNTNHLDGRAEGGRNKERRIKKTRKLLTETQWENRGKEIEKKDVVIKRH